MTSRMRGQRTARRRVRAVAVRPRQPEGADGTSPISARRAAGTILIGAPLLLLGVCVGVTLARAGFDESKVQREARALTITFVAALEQGDDEEVGRLWLAPLRQEPLPAYDLTRCLDVPRKARSWRTHDYDPFRGFVLTKVSYDSPCAIDPGRNRQDHVVVGATSGWVVYIGSAE